MKGGFRNSEKFGFKYHTDLFKNEKGERIPIKRPRIEVVFRKYSEKTNPDTNPEFRAFALVDSGSDVCYIPKQIADILKLERNEENKKESIGVGKKIWTYRTKVYLEIVNKGRRIGVDMVEVAFPEKDPEGIELDINILLGRKGLFTNYEITFNDLSGYMLFKHIQKDNR